MPNGSAHRVYLHIGAPKTGTSYLQRLVYENRRTLRSHGVLRPGLGPGDHFRAMLDLRDMTWKGYHHPAVAGSWRRVAAASRRWPGTVVISHELLAGATDEQIRRAVGSFGSAEVHIVYTARDLGRVIASAWQQNLRSGGRRTFQQFVQSLERRHGKQAGVFWSNHDLPEVLSRWGYGLPPGHVHIVTTPTDGGGAEVLWGRFAAVIGVDPAAVSFDHQPRNVSLGATEAQLLRAVNDRLAGRLPSSLYRSLVSRGLAEQVLAAREDRLAYGLPARSYGWVRARAEEHVRAAQQRGYDVVGDLSDLLPTPAGADVAVPGRIPARQELDAAVDGIVGMLLLEVEQVRHPLRTMASQTAQAVRYGGRPAGRPLAYALSRTGLDALARRLLGAGSRPG